MKQLKILKITLAAARVNAKMTQEEVANLMKISKRTIVNWENGKTLPSFAELSMLSAIYGIPVDNIFLSTEST